MAEPITLAKALQELRRLNQRVRRPARLPSPAEIDDAEQQLGVVFHLDYRQFLQEASDVVYGTKEPARVAPDAGYNNLAKVANDAWTYMFLPRRLLPFCEDNGDYFCMEASGTSPEVIYWSHDGAPTETWPSLAEWIHVVWIGEYQDGNDL